MRGVVAAALVVFGVLAPTSSVSSAGAPFRQVVCAEAGVPVSLMWVTAAGGAGRADTVFGGRGVQCRVFVTSAFAGYAVVSARRSGVRVRCEVWRGSVLLRREVSGPGGSGVVSCYLTPAQQGQR